MKNMVSTHLRQVILSVGQMCVCVYFYIINIIINYIINYIIMLLIFKISRKISSMQLYNQWEVR